MSLKVESSHRKKLIRERICLYKSQAEKNNNLNAQCRQILNSLSQNTRQEKYLIKPNKPTILQNTNNLIKYVSLREHYFQHSNYWQKIWSFTLNPIYENGKLNLVIILKKFT